jgi:hypothetical protein
LISLLFISSFLLANTLCPSELTIPADYTELDKNIEKKISEAANLVTISQEADRVLTQLMRSNNPALTTWLQQMGFGAGNPLAIARQWRTYYLKNYILNKFPTPNPKINASVEALFADINKMAFPQDKKTEIEQIFKTAKKEMKQTLIAMPIPEDTQKQIIEQIEQTPLYWLGQLKGGPFQNQPLKFLNTGLTYDESKQQLLIGVQILRLPDSDSIMSRLIEGMTSSFDFCHWDKNLSQVKNPFTHLVQCFRESKSANAKTRDDRLLNQWLSKKVITEEKVDYLRNQPLCNDPLYPPAGSQKEQVNQVFADWFTAEVLAQRDPLRTPIRSDLCLLGKQPAVVGSAELSAHDRLMRIYYTQPTINKKLNPTTSFNHCPLK